MRYNSNHLSCHVSVGVWLNAALSWCVIMHSVRAVSVFLWPRVVLCFVFLAICLHAGFRCRSRVCDSYPFVLPTPLLHTPLGCLLLVTCSFAPFPSRVQLVSLLSPFPLLPITIIRLPDVRLVLFVLSAREDLLFFARCLAALAGVVANSAPAAVAWYDLLNTKTLLGTGVPCHPWVGGTASSGVVPSFPPVVDPDEGEAALFLAMTSAADKDEWSAMLVGAGLVRSLVNSLQACLDFRTAVRGLASTKASAAAGKPGSSARGGNSSSSACGGGTDSFRRATQPLTGEGASGREQAAKSTKAGNVGVPPPNDGCLGRELEVTQAFVVVALGALLSAHPLAARDRFQLSGGMLRVHRVIFQLPKNPQVGEMRECVSSRGEGCSDAAATLVFPCLREHCALVALQVLRLCLRADDAVTQLPPGVVEGVVRLVGALSPSMRLVGGLPRMGLADGDEKVQDGGPEVGGNRCDRRGGLSHTFLPLGVLGEVPAPEPRVTFGVTEETEAGARASAAAASLSESSGPATEARRSLDSPSYRLCG